jgi:hypothetical protein
VRLLCLIGILFFVSCASTQPKLQPKDTRPKPSQKNWEYLYAQELSAALENNDVAAYYFFWPLYMNERNKNKCKNYNPLHNVECNCEE